MAQGIRTQGGFSAFIYGDRDSRSGIGWHVAGRICLAALIAEIGNVGTAEQLIAQGLAFVKCAPGGATTTTREV